MGKTLAQLITNARQLSNTQKSKFVTDDELGDYVNRAVRVLYDLITASDESYYNESIDISFGNNNEAGATMPLPPDFQKVRGVTRFPDSLQASPVYAKTFTNHQIGQLGYLLDGNNISMEPFQLAAAGPFRLTYVQKPLQFGPAINVQTNVDNVSGAASTWTWSFVNLPAIQSLISASVTAGASLLVNGANNAGNNGALTISSIGVSSIVTSGTGPVAETFGPFVSVSILLPAVTPAYPNVSPYQAPSMAQLDTTLDNFDDFISCWTALRIVEKKKDSESAQMLGAMLDAITQRVNAMAPDRSAEPQAAPVLWQPSLYPYRGIFPGGPGWDGFGFD